MSDKCNKLLTTLLADLTLRFYIAPGIQLKAGGISVADLICRAELHGSPSREQYDEFHAGMEALGLERTIARDGKVFRLPTGEYLGVNLPTSSTLLALKITSLAFRITASPCKLTITPVSNPAEIHISGLEEVVSFATELGAFASLFLTSPPQPTPSGFSALAALASSKSASKDIPASLQFGFLTGLKP
jgi:hypothetical protein